jgi:hypothetical protein
MKNLSGRFRLFVAILGCSASLAIGQSVVRGTDTAQQIMASNQKLSFEGANKTFQILGHDDEVTITGDCSAVSVLGTNNKVILEGVGVIQAGGSGNLVTYRRGLNGDATPKISTMGDNNKVVAAQ